MDRGLRRRPSFAVRRRIVVTSPVHGAWILRARDTSRRARWDRGESSPDSVACPLFAGATAAHPSDAALTAGSSLQRLAQAPPQQGKASPGPGRQSRAASPGPTEGGWVGQTTSQSRARTLTTGEQVAAGPLSPSPF